MSYILIAKIDDMSRAEAKAIFMAMLRRFGTSFAEPVIEEWRKESAHQEAQKDALAAYDQATQTHE